MIMLFNGAGFYMYYAVELHRIKNEMHTALLERPDKELQLLKMTRGQFEDALIEENEIRVEGKTYDVARLKKAGDSLYVYGMHDQAEDDLFTTISKLVADPLKNQNNTPQPVIKFMSLIFLIPANETLFKPLKALDENNIPEDFSMNSLTLPVECPPPWEKL
jgi:hypothetical protein